jgi:hypothetical protein
MIKLYLHLNIHIYSCSGSIVKANYRFREASPVLFCNNQQILNINVVYLLPNIISVPCVN